MDVTAQISFVGDYTETDRETLRDHLISADFSIGSERLWGFHFNGPASRFEEVFQTKIVWRGGTAEFMESPRIPAGWSPPTRTLVLYIPTPPGYFP